VISIGYTDKIEKICTYCCPVRIALPHPISEANWVRSGDNRTTIATIALSLRLSRAQILKYMTSG
jgi:hypothetical protein